MYQVLTVHVEVHDLGHMLEYKCSVTNELLFVDWRVRSTNLVEGLLSAGEVTKTTTVG